MTRNEFIQTASIAFRTNGAGAAEAWTEAAKLADAAPVGTFDAPKSAPVASSGASGGAVTGPLPTTLPGYGRAKGEPIAGASRENLHYYIAGCRKTLSDPAKERWHDKERAMLAALEAELAKPSAPQDDGRRAPPVAQTTQDDGDSGDIPF